MRLLAAIGALCLIGFGSMVSQTSLELVDQLPPYLLSARLLNNGHFSITTNYTSTTKTLIYREDGTGNRPVNYTSHIHVKVDDVVFQLPFESNPGTDLPPPPNPLKVLHLFRDTVAQRPRINALMLALMPGNDSIRVTFTMEPVKRPSGGFIRLSVAVENAGTSAHNIGVLMLVDTKIGDNDRAPIGTAFGYSGVESEFRTSQVPGIPEFWIAFEGTPLAPGLTARGNLRESELIEPDRFLFGNWVDDNGTGTPGLFRVLWDERSPSGLSFTDSAILLLWEQEQMAARARRLLASTEIGIVDSLSVSFGSGGGGGGGGSLGVAGPGECFNVATDDEIPCGELSYHPYSPNIVSSLFVVTNTGTNIIDGVRLYAGAVPAGVAVVASPTSVITSTLASDQTGVGVMSFDLRPRLAATSYSIPVHFVADPQDTILTSSLCINVPGILASIEGHDLVTLPVCPGEKDTFAIPVDLHGVRCLPVSSARVIAPAGAPARVVSPLPLLPVDGQGFVFIESAPLVEQTINVDVEIIVRDWESLIDGDTTWVDVKDTVTVTIIGRLAEFAALTPGDTLVLPPICVGDSTVDSLQVQNVGGCDVNITNVRLSNSAGGTFFIDTRTTTPLTIARAARGQVYVGASNVVAGTYVGELEIISIARPGTLRIPVKITIDQPAYALQSDTLDMDTICLLQKTAGSFRLLNQTGCDIRIDSVRSLGPDPLTVSPGTGFTIGPRSSVTLSLLFEPTISGVVTSTIRVYSSVGGNRDVVVVAYSNNTSMNVSGDLDLGRRRVGLMTAIPGDMIFLSNRGAIPISITSLTIAGQHPADFRVEPTSGGTLPQIVPPFGAISFDVAAIPRAIGDRTANVSFQTDPPLCEALDVVQVHLYGTQPLIDIEQHQVSPGRVCLGAVVDTTISIRNLGNESFDVTDIIIEGSPSFTISQSLPFTIDSGQTQQVALRITTSDIGPISSEMKLTTNADWFTPNDTTVKMDVQSTLCASLWADTVDGDVGEIENINIHLQADERTSLSTQELIDALVRQAAPVEFTVTSDSTLSRFTDDVAGQTSGAAATTTASSVHVTAPYLTDPTSQTFAILSADFLLGPNNRSPVTLSVTDLAGGFHDLRIGPGLLRTQYCALDQRRVTATVTGIKLYHHGNDIRLLGLGGGSARVTWYTVNGSRIATSEHHLTSEQTVFLEPPAASGPVFLVVETVEGVQTTVAF